MILKISFRAIAIFVCVMSLFTTNSAAYAAAGDTVMTERKIVSQIQVSAGQDEQNYYIKAENGWEVAGCNGALYAYIDRNSPGADAILSTALTARSTGKPIAVYGTCGNAGGDTLYIQIRSVFF